MVKSESHLIGNLVLLNNRSASISHTVDKVGSNRQASTDGIKRGGLFSTGPINWFTKSYSGSGRRFVMVVGSRPKCNIFIYFHRRVRSKEKV
ncbi:unnamed protein product [Schistosoma curassoni]|uniref:Transposase n=1 Tax=Schistosoma curassoni TaxID=6186 RepID=A0A183JDM2_9TREM|nr:unnamed protein product [Schistosoma curassoni]